MKLLSSLCAIVMLVPLVGCGQPSQEQVESVSQENSSNSKNAEQVRMNTVSMNSADSSIYIPSESESSSTNLSEFALNGGNDFGMTDAGSQSDAFQFESMNSQPQFQGTGADLSSFDL